MYYAALCGIEACRKFGKRPDLPSGHYQRHLDAVLPMYRDASAEYELDLVVADKHKPGRSKTMFPVLVPQEELNNELENTPGWTDMLEHAKEQKSFPAAYDSHPVTLANLTAYVVPIALFVDGVPYSNVDSLIGFWIINVLTQSRHLVVSLRKSLLCQCGCRGWCTFWAIFYYLHWCLACAANGRLAEGRHDNAAWRDSDAQRMALAGNH